MPARKNFESTGHTLSTVPTSGSRLSSVGTTKTAGVMENIGSATSEQFKTGDAFFKAIDTLKPAVTPPVPGPPVAGLVNDGTETPATPYISLTKIVIPSSWTPTYTGKTENLSHSISVSGEKSNSGTYQIFPNVNLVVSAGAVTPAVNAGVSGATSTTEAKITGSAAELNTWVSPWNDPSSSIPHFNGGDYGQLRSPGFCKEHPENFFIVTITLTFGLLFDQPTANTVGDSKEEFDFEICIINNYDNDRDVYLTAYENAYGSLSKVPELDERNY